MPLGTLLLFLGDLLHCVLHPPPPPLASAPTEAAPRRTLLVNIWPCRPRGAAHIPLPPLPPLAPLTHTTPRPPPHPGRAAMSAADGVSTGTIGRTPDATAPVNDATAAAVAVTSHPAHPAHPAEPAEPAAVAAVAAAPSPIVLTLTSPAPFERHLEAWRQQTLPVMPPAAAKPKTLSLGPGPSLRA